MPSILYVIQCQIVKVLLEFPTEVLLFLKCLSLPKTNHKNQEISGAKEYLHNQDRYALAPKGEHIFIF